VLTPKMLLVPPPYDCKDQSIVSPKTSFVFSLFSFPDAYICKEHDWQKKLAKMFVFHDCPGSKHDGVQQQK